MFIDVRFEGPSVDAVAIQWNCYFTTFDIDLLRGNELGEKPTRPFSAYLKILSDHSK